MMKYALSFLLSIFITSISSQPQFEYEIIKELIPYNIIFTKYQTNNYKIFQYIPLCNETNSSLTTIYAQITSGSSIDLFIYDDLSKIEISENVFINNISNFEITSINPINEISLSCGKEYYFVIFNPYLLNFIEFCQFSIINKEINKIDISSLSQNSTLTFYVRPNNDKEIFFYSSNETKYILIQLYGFSGLKIVEINETEGENVILDEYNGFISKLFEFKKDKEYYIYFNSSSPITFKFYNNTDYNLHNFNKDGPLILGTTNYIYNFEIDISDYNIGDYIVFYMIFREDYISVKYQFKNNFKSNNYINIGEYKDGFYFIQIKKTVQDSSMILNLNINSVSHKDSEILTLFDTFKYDFEEITLDYNKTIIGPKLFCIDDFKFNKNFNSYGIQSNESYFFLESENGNANLLYHRNISIINRNYKQAINKVFYIFFNNQNYSLFEVKTFNYIIYNEIGRFKTYFQLCQGKDFNNELIFYIDNSLESVYPVFGKYNISFIDEDNIKKLSDLDFNNKKENKMYWNSKGYLKITCNEPTMIKHFNHSNNNNNNLFSGERITVSFDNLEKENYYLDSSLVDEVIPLKFNILGLDNNESIQLQLNLYETIYELKNSKTF